jgi:catechol 2,3-dioxygenase
MVPDIQYLRDIWLHAESIGATNIRGINHLNSLSVYFYDPENNTVEVYLDMPFYVPQPYGEPLDLSLTDQEIMEYTEMKAKQKAGFQKIDQWQNSFE